MMTTKVIEIFSRAVAIPVGGITFIVFLMISDILSGIFKAIVTNRGINSTIGTNGLIRKAGVLLALLVFIVVDSLVELNLVSVIPQAVLEGLQLQHTKIGLSTIMLGFFGLFELSSLFENLGKIGVPLPHFLTKLIERLKDSFEGEE